jgi:hypothetical protein
LVLATEVGDRESAGLPALEQFTPVLLLVGITGFALAHGWYLRNMVKEKPMLAGYSPPQERCLPNAYVLLNFGSARKLEWKRFVN